MQPSSGIPPREVKDMQFDLDARRTVMEAIEVGYNAVSSTYGPSGQNVLQGMPYGDPVVTRDGVTVAKRVVLPDRAHDDAWKIMRQAAEQTNKIAGDGTTATVVLARNLLVGMNQRVVAGENPMKLKAQLVIDSRKVISFIKEQSKPVGKHLLDIATVSSGDANIGALVADMLTDVGVDGGISIREQNYPTIDVEKINGYYFTRGFTALNQQVEWEKPNILVTQKQLTSAADMLPIIRLVNTLDEKKLVIVGEVRSEALQILLANTMAQQDAQGRPVPFEGLVIPPPAYNEEAKLFMEDIATYVGGVVYTEANNEVTAKHFGSSDQVQVDAERAIIFSGHGETDAIVNRAAEIKTNIDKETNAHVKDNLEGRYSKLVGKIAIVNVGASTQAEMEELRFRVEDAIEATKSAMKDGIVPGGGTVLVHAALAFDTNSLFSKALNETFKKLFDNAGEDASYRLTQIKNSTLGKGFNLRKMTDEPIDLTKAGIFDATRVLVQTIENAVSAAGTLLTVGTLMTPQDDVVK